MIERFRTSMTPSKAITLVDLPAPPPEKVGWPWTEQSNLLPCKMADGSEWPKISIITPSYNQGQFIEQTIRSVLLQGYPNLEYIIIDGGSSDNTLEILFKYDKHIDFWISEEDRGQSHALNKGFYYATGDLIGWQNSDDYYHSEAFIFAAKAFVESQNVDIVYGSTSQVDVQDNILPAKSFKPLNNLEDMLPWPLINNQSTFFCKKIFSEQFFINESLHYAMDYEFFWRLAIANYRFLYVSEIKGYQKIHSSTKGSTMDHLFLQEFFQVYKLIYSQNNLSIRVKKKALTSLRTSCLMIFADLQLRTYRKHYLELVDLNKLSLLNLRLLLLFLLSFLGTKSVVKLKKIKQIVYTFKKCNSIL